MARFVAAVAIVAVFALLGFVLPVLMPPPPVPAPSSRPPDPTYRPYIPCVLKATPPPDLHGFRLDFWFLEQAKAEGCVGTAP